MSRNPRNDARRQAWWGVLIIAMGLYFLIRQFATFDVPSLGDLWPAFVVGFGLVRLLSWRNAEDVEGGIFFILIGLWFFACEFYWWGWTYRDSWPVAVIILGLSFIVRALLEHRARSRAGGEA